MMVIILYISVITSQDTTRLNIHPPQRVPKRIRMGHREKECEKETANLLIQNVLYKWQWWSYKFLLPVISSCGWVSGPRS